MNTDTNFRKQISSQLNKGEYAAKIRLEQFKQCVSNFQAFLPPQKPDSKPCLVLDLDNTLVYATEEATQDFDFIIPVKSQTSHSIRMFYVKKRPHLDAFLETASKYFEIVLFSAAQSEYAELVVEQIDPHQQIDYRLQRQACSNFNNKFLYKDLGQLGRDLDRMQIVDDNPLSQIKHRQNAVPIIKQVGGSDNALYKLMNKIVQIFENKVNQKELIAKSPLNQSDTTMQNVNTNRDSYSCNNINDILLITTFQNSVSTSNHSFYNNC